MEILFILFLLFGICFLIVHYSIISAKSLLKKLGVKFGRNKKDYSRSLNISTVIGCLAELILIILWKDEILTTNGQQLGILATASVIMLIGVDVGVIELTHIIRSKRIQLYSINYTPLIVNLLLAIIAIVAGIIGLSYFGVSTLFLIVAGNGSF